MQKIRMIHDHSCYLHQDKTEIAISYTCAWRPNFANTNFKPNEFLIILCEFCLLFKVILKIVFLTRISLIIRKNVGRELKCFLFLPLFLQFRNTKKPFSAFQRLALNEFMQFSAKMDRCEKKYFRWLFLKLFLSAKTINQGVITQSIHRKKSTDNENILDGKRI